MSSKLTQSEFIERSRKLHNNKYSYCKTVYINSRTKVIIICDEHGEFTQLPNHHLQGRGCLQCFRRRKRFTTQDFIKKAILIHGNKYDYALVDYINKDSKVKINCFKHGIFEQNANNHLRGSNCPVCTNRCEITTEDFIEKAIKIHGNKYNYDKVEYKKATSKVRIKCAKHGIFLQQPNNHLTGHNCPKCDKKISKPELEVQNFIRKLGITISTNKRNLISPLELDIFIPSLNKAIEFNGLYYHYSKRYFVPGKHSNKSNLCREKGIKLLHIREDLWKKDKEKMKQVIIKFLKYGEKMLL